MSCFAIQTFSNEKLVREVILGETMVLQMRGYEKNSGTYYFFGKEKKLVTS